MISLKMFFASEARASLFKLLKMVEGGDDVVILNRETNRKFRLSLVNEEGTSDKEIILHQLLDLNFRSKPPKEIKKIIQDKYA